MSNEWCRRFLPLAIGVATCLSIPSPRMAAAPGKDLSVKVAAAVWEQARNDGSGLLDIIVSYHGKPGLLERAEVERLGAGWPTRSAPAFSISRRRFRRRG